ncbi:MAG: amidohydrolase family protein [Spirochaetaceae bacterium]|nr:amidohydrolase family protein [Spirochaetaceae bacterium]
MNNDESYDYLLKNATIVDGLNNKEFKGSIIIKNDKIFQIIKNENDLKGIRANKTIDVNSRYIFPGFIDFHGHSDLQVLRDPQMKCKIQQGITTEIAGNCGVGMFPVDTLNHKATKNLIDSSKDVLGKADICWSDFSTYTSCIEKKGTGTNIMFLQAHSALRIAVIPGNSNREATSDEIKLMCNFLDRSLTQGCIGLSSGLYYAPCLYASKKELIALLTIVKAHNKIFAVHHRCEGDDVISSIEEVIDLARITRVRLEISHLKAIGIENQKHVEQIISLIDNARAEGIDVAFDQYPYDFGSTSISSMLPPSVLKLSRKNLKITLADKNERNRIKDLIKKGEGFDSLIKMCGFDNIRIMYLENHRDLEGLSFRNLAQKLYNKNDEDSCYDAFFDILIQEDGIALMEDVTQSIESLEKILSHEAMCFSTDALYSSSNPSVPTHPRSYSAAVHYLELFYKERHTLPLESLIYRMSGKPADRLHLQDRGSIEEGKKADLVICDLENLKDLSTLSESKNPPKGIDCVFVNGNLVYENNEMIGAPKGEILKL